MSSSETTETIAALATPAGVGALAILRVSGTSAIEALRPMLPDGFEWQPRVARHVELRQRGQLLDDVVLTYWRGPKSHTGEDVVELSCHGNPLIAQRILEALFENGARQAEPGEFTSRAFLNGKLDLTQAEAVLDLIHAETDRALAGAQAMKAGKLAARLEVLRRDLIDLLAHLEAYIDFPEEDIEPETGAQFEQRVAQAIEVVDALIATAPLGRILREGVTTAIVGAPNVGKSSLLNALLRENRAIVSARPGTTRDTIEAECNVRGLRLRLIDTAGQRATDDEIESEGIERARRAAAEADLVLHVVESHRAEVDDDFDPATLREGQVLLRVANKADLGADPVHADAIHVSATTGSGMDELEAEIEARLVKSGGGAHENWLTVNARQESALRRAVASLQTALEALHCGTPPELVSVDLRGALQEIGTIVGLATNEDILDQLFKNFCIGK